MRGRRFLSVILLAALSICGNSFAQEQQEREEVTLTTYYPAPYGDYNNLTTTTMTTTTMQLRPSPAPPANPAEGMLYFNDGTDATTPKGLYIYKDKGWEMVGGITEPQFIGGCIQGKDQYLRCYYSTNWWTVPLASMRTYANPWSLYYWQFAEGGNPHGVLSIDGTIDRRIRLDLAASENVTPGIYQITWGGGTFTFELGTKVEFRLYYQRTGMDNYGILDTFTIENPNASDSLPDNFGQINDENPVDIPLRSVSYNLAGRTWKMNLIVKVEPVALSIADDPDDPNDELGGDRSDSDWHNWTFPNTPPDAVTGITTKTFKYHNYSDTHVSKAGYSKEYNTWTTINSRGAGKILGLTLKIEKIR